MTPEQVRQGAKLLDEISKFESLIELVERNYDIDDMVGKEQREFLVNLVSDGAFNNVWRDKNALTRIALDAILANLSEELESLQTQLSKL